VGFADVVIAAVVLAAAGWLLWRSIRKGGSCHGCAGGCGRAPGGGPDLVRLGRRSGTQSGRY